MTRNEMLRVLAIYLWENYDLDNCDNKADDILSLLENAGMQPPLDFMCRSIWED